MGKLVFKVSMVLAAIQFLTSCGTVPFKVITEPEVADVYIVNPETKEEKNLGQTPLLKTDKDLSEHLKGQNYPGGLVNIIIRKDGFKAKDIWVPINAGGQLGTQLVLKLDPTTSSSDELKTAQDLLQKLFLSQQFAKSAQLERALIEIDKILEVFPKFDRALSMKAAIHYAKGEFEESLKWYENALAVNPELKTAIDMAGKVRDTLRIPNRLPAQTPSSNEIKATLENSLSPNPGAKKASP